MAALFLKTVPDQTGKLVVLTGGNSGIGLEACAMLASKGAKVVFTSRSQTKADEAKVEILRKAKEYNPQLDEAKTEVIPTLLDLSDMESVLAYRSQLESAIGAGVGIDILILNAGVMAPKTRQETKDGFELQIATNCYGHYVLTCKLFDLLKLSKTPSRVVSLSSIAQFTAPPFRGITFTDLDRKRGYRSASVYAETKLGNILFAKKLARIMQEHGLDKQIISVACHPGISKTPLFREGNQFGFLGALGQSVPMGTTPTVLAATDVNAKPGAYAGPRFFLRGAARWNRMTSWHANNSALQDKFWLAMEEKTGCKLEL